jgi:hypothetical protein
MFLKSNFLTATTFNDFSKVDQILEASELSKTGMPKEMVRAVHQKAEHFTEKYPRMAHTYRGGVAIPMPYKHYVPTHDVKLVEPTVATGEKTNVDPYSGRTIKSFYTDFHWFIESLPFGPNRVLITNPDLDFYMYIYDKSKSKGAPGMQYAIMWWDPISKKAIDFGYSELTTRAVDKAEIRKVHDTKGGNRSDKIQEFIRTVTRQGKDYAPSRNKPLYLYKLEVEGAARKTRAERVSAQAPVQSVDVLSVFAKKFTGVADRLSPQLKNRLKDALISSNHSAKVAAPEEFKEMADALGTDSNKLFAFLFDKMKDFRNGMFEEGRGRLAGGTSAYTKTTGFELEAENSTVDKYQIYPGWRVKYEISKKKYSPDEERAETPTDYREAQPEKYRRELPVPGEYASIQSLIKKHTLDGFLNKFAAFLITGKIHFADVSVASILGVIAPEGADSGKVEAEDDNWLF